jgi:diaminohydroxyphosphoribosylaminopyrimidine deaminase / 5-amino-6-(5-phosphoribosylamino)uracil reductase
MRLRRVVAFGPSTNPITFGNIFNRLMQQAFPHAYYMQRCLQLAAFGQGLTAPNPMVGSLIVCDDQIIGEGWHIKAGGPHAEVRAIASVKQPELLKKSTLYVSLEPCAHFGRTPPCASLIVKMQIPKVVIACRDPFPQVAGKGIQILKDAGVDVVVGVLEKAALSLNRRFITYHTKKRPFVILKWAATADGFIDPKRAGNKGSIVVSGPHAGYLNHKWRTIEGAILVGYRTALTDNPELTPRHYSGPEPLRIVEDFHGKLPTALNLWRSPGHTWCLVGPDAETRDLGPSVNVLRVSDSKRWPLELMSYLHEAGIQSLIVEGGSATHQKFLDLELADEIRRFQSKSTKFGAGTPQVSFSDFNLLETRSLPQDRLEIWLQ